MMKGDKILPILAKQAWKQVVEHWRDLCDEYTLDRYLSIRFDEKGEMEDNAHYCFLRTFADCIYRDWRKKFDKTVKALRDNDYIDYRGVLLRPLPKPKPKPKIWVDEDDVHLFDCFLEEETYGNMELSHNAASY